MTNLPTLEEQIKLYQFGYYLIGPEIGKAADLDFLLNCSEETHLAAAARYQKFFEVGLDDSALSFHGRGLHADGDWGPVSRHELSKPRCGFPDILPAMTQQGNWPGSCRDQITTSYSNDMNSLNGLNAQLVRELVTEAAKNWNDALQLKIVLTDGYPQTRIYKFPAVLGGSVLADQMLATSNCNDRSRGRVDSNRTWNPVLFVTTYTHEDGHALGAPHSGDPAATMYPSITSASMARRGKPNASDLRIMTGLGYQIRTEPDDPDPPDPPGDGYQPPFSFRGQLPLVDANGKFAGNFRIELQGVPG